MKLRPLLLQVGVQVAMAGMRFVALGVMVAGSLLADGGGSASPPHRLALVDARGFGLAISTALFSQLFQHSVPGLIKPLRPAPTGRAVRGVFFAALGTTTALYLVLGSLGARAFVPIWCEAGFDEEGGEADVRRRLLRVAASLKPSGPLATAASFDLRAFCGSPLGTLL